MSKLIVEDILFYRPVRQYVRVVLHFLFKKFQVHGTENIPKDAAVIYVVNHQNAFLDAVLIACATNHEPWFLTRAGVFGNAIVKTFLRWCHMMPVYRFRDGWKSLRNNDVTIRQCVDLLSARKSILVFVEGDQSLKWQLRNLQKGFARIALAAQQENNWKLPLYLLPVGVQYDEYYSFRSRVLLKYGAPIPVDASYQALPEREFLDALIEKVKIHLKPLMLHIENDQYAEIEAYLKQHRDKNDLLEQLKTDQAIVANWKERPLQVTAKKSPNYFLLIAGLPLYVYTLFNNILPFSLTSWLLKKYVTPEFKGSLKLAFGMLIVPIFYLIQSVIVQLLFSEWRFTVGYALTLPFISIWSVDLFKSAMRK